MGQVITKTEADQILSVDLKVVERRVGSQIGNPPFTVKGCEFDALVDLAYNIGLPRLRSSTLMALYREGHKAEAAEQFLQWDRAGGRAVGGLVTRRKADRQWFLTGTIDAVHQVALGIMADTEDMPHVVDHPDGIWQRLVNRWFS